MKNPINYNLEPSTADAVQQNLKMLTPSEARVPGTNPPKPEYCSTTDKILGRKPE